MGKLPVAASSVALMPDVRVCRVDVLFAEWNLLGVLDFNLNAMA